MNLVSIRIDFKTHVKLLYKLDAHILDTITIIQCQIIPLMKTINLDER